MSSGNPIADRLDIVNTTYENVLKSEAALKGDSMSGLRALSIEQLAALAHDACWVLQQLGKHGYGYEIAMIEQHLERPGDTRCMWIVSQADCDGSFNKMEKSFGAATEPRGEDGPKLTVPLAVFNFWKEAKGYLDALPVGCQANRIFPVVVTAGREPRTTQPLSEQ